MKQAVFIAANLTEITTTEEVIVTNFEEANLEKADLSCAKLQRANLQKANLSLQSKPSISKVSKS